jgi:protein ImuB
LPPAALRVEQPMLDRLHKLGLTQVRHLLAIPAPALRRRFGPELLLRLDQAMGQEEETIQPVVPAPSWQERLPCPEPIATATGIEIALQRLLDTLCRRLQQEEKGLRTAAFKAYRVDGKMEEIAIGTNRATHNAAHLFKLFEIKIPTIEPDLGIELFVLEAAKVEDLSPLQEKLWEGDCGLENTHLAQLLDRIAGKVGAAAIHRYLPDEHYWPERSIKLATSLNETTATAWRADRPRPIQLLAKPEPIEVTAPIPDYPPMLFRYKGKLHTIKKADGPERIEREWWLEEGPHRDYYSVEDEEGARYWLFRSGHYTGDKTQQWFIHGFFA